MKALLIITIFISNLLFANYSYTGQNNGNIDMHSGKSEKLIDKKNSLSDSNFNSIGIIKPVAPIAPKQLIKDEDVKKKENNK